MKKYNIDVVNSAARKFNVSNRYIRKLLHPDINSALADEVKKFYKVKLIQLEKILK